jgi:hypothetical protein
MSDPKEFLARWSQRKLNPETEKSAPEKKTAALPAADDKRASTPDAEFDITSLPSLESIVADSDIRAFLQRGVPAGLTRAALRRAWSADPAIRDFIGLSENSWDFNAPDSIPGFGPLNADEVRQAAARFFGELTEETTGQTPTDMQASAENSAETEQAMTNVKESDCAPAPAQQRSPDIAAQQEQEVAAQHNAQTESTDAPAPPRRHGAALPK